MSRSIDEARALLGVTADTSPAAVAQAYRRLARMTHPDVSPAPDAAERFVAVCTAYDLLQHVSVDPAPEPEPDLTVPPRVAVRFSASPLAGAAGYAGLLQPVIVAGPVTVRPSNPAKRRPGWKADR